MTEHYAGSSHTPKVGDVVEYLPHYEFTLLIVTELVGDLVRCEEIYGDIIPAPMRDYSPEYLKLVSRLVTTDMLSGN